jgi:hypothetical protein
MIKKAKTKKDKEIEISRISSHYKSIKKTEYAIKNEKISNRYLCKKR